MENEIYKLELTQSEFDELLISLYGTYKVHKAQLERIQKEPLTMEQRLTIIEIKQDLAIQKELLKKLSKMDRESTKESRALIKNVLKDS